MAEFPGVGVTERDMQWAALWAEQALRHRHAVEKKEIKLVITLTEAEDGSTKSRINLETPDSLDALQVIGVLALAMRLAEESVSGGDWRNE